MTAMDDLGAAKNAARTAMRTAHVGVRGAERVEQLLDDYQQALKRAHAQHLAARIRATGDRLGRNTRNAYYGAAALLEETETP